MNNNIIKILPKIYISDTDMVSIDYINDNNITDVIDVNLNSNNDNENNTGIRKININSIINYTDTNNLILQIIKSNGSCVIISKNNLMGFLIVCGFLIEYIGMTLIESLSLCKKYNINISNYNTQDIEKLFNFYKLKMQ